MLSVQRTVLYVVILTLAFGCNSPARDPALSSSLDKKRLCTQMGWDFYDRYKRRLPHTTGIVLPVFTYDNKHDTCVCVVGNNIANPIKGKPPLLTRQIVDVTTNRIIFEFFLKEEEPPEFKAHFQEVMGYEYNGLPLDGELMFSESRN